MISVLEGSNTAIPVYNEFRSQLSDLRKLNDSATFDYEDPKGNKDARSHIYRLRQTKAAVEKARKAEKAESLEYGRRVDEQAKEIITEIEVLIEVHETPIKEIEQREADRVASLEARLADIKAKGTSCADGWETVPSESLDACLSEVEAIELGEDRWQEFAIRIEYAKTAALAMIRGAIARRVKRDSEQAELERLRKEAEERERAEREERIRKEAAGKAAKETEERAERARREAAEKAQQRELELKHAAERAEREKIEAETRTAEAAKFTEERLAREAREKANQDAAELAKREADNEHRALINRAAIEAFVGEGIVWDDAEDIVRLIAKRAIPHVTIAY